MPKGLRILIVDDVEGIRFFLTQTLQREGYDITTAGSGEAALEQLRENFFNLILLDLNLGGRVDGIRVLETVRWRWPETAVVILTAHGTMDSALAAIREGVDGYLLKPVEPDDVRQAVQEALSRRKSLTPKTMSTNSDHILQYNKLALDKKKHVAILDGQVLVLTLSEFRLLAYLIDNINRVVPPKELVLVVRNYECKDNKEAREIIKWFIHRLRRKIEHNPSKPEYIITVRGVGYTLGKK